MAGMETAIRWSPSSTINEQRFLLVDVPGRSFRHCIVEKYDGKDLSYRTLSVNRNVPVFRAFDWSPHNESIAAVGEWSGSATVLMLDHEQPSPLSLPIKSQRPVNAVTFAKTGLLAVGLERVRNDFSLNLWDVDHRLPVNTATIASPGKSTFDPVRKLASSEGITSIKFFHAQPDTLVAGVKGACIRLYDLREHVGTPSIQFSTTSVHNISIDPLDENYFAAAGAQKDATIQIWDRRFGLPPSATSLGSGVNPNAQAGPVLEYKKAFESSTAGPQPSIWSLRFCRGQRGFLGALASNGAFQAFEIKQTYAAKPSQSQDQTSWAYGGQSQVQPQLRTERVHHVEIFPEKPTQLRQETARTIAFDFTNLAGPKGRPSAIVVQADKSISVYELKGSRPAFALSSTGQLVSSRFGNRPKIDGSKPEDSLSQAGLFHTSLPIAERTMNVTESTGKAENFTEQLMPRVDPVEWTGRLSSRENHERWFEKAQFRHNNTLGGALSSLDLSRHRCTQGYLFDCRKNVDIVADDPWLQDMWEWIRRAKRLAVDESFVIRGIDLSYLGVYNIWNIDLGSEKAVRISGTSENAEILYAIEAICRTLELPEVKSVETSLPAHRRLCLHICGFGIPREDLENTVKAFINQGRNTQAAALALAHDRPEQALFALKAGSTSAHRELSLALAGYVKGVADDVWNETITDIASSLTDPYARAILALVRNGSWHDVLSETCIPLHYRIGVAIMYLPDADLTTYIATLTDDCIQHGDIEGIPLTGLSEKAIPLLQHYILKYHDLQTAILAISHTSPRYFPSPLVDIWRSEYRSRLNTYRFFIPRVRFDTGATKLSAPPGGGKPTLAPPARQVSLQCNNCEQPLDRNPAHAPANAPPLPPPSSTQAGSIFADHKSGTVCPKCGKHMPRCVICMHWLGMPDPHSKGGAYANAVALERSGGSVDGRERGERRGRDLMKEFITVCRSCWHMAHAAHAEEWFRRNRECPVPGCGCRCGEL
ncbi:MAG: hypothetical protein Q9219_001290 [cf. Caloplaca sp. 3 TL-2023]